MGRAQLGVDLASEKRDLSDEEQDEDLKVRSLSPPASFTEVNLADPHCLRSVDSQDQEIREFGHTFLLPIGVVKTQEELDAVVRPPSSLNRLIPN